MSEPGGSGRIVAVVGAGVTGAYTATSLAEHGLRVAVYDTDRHAAALLARRVKGVVLADVDELSVTDAVALCHPAPHCELAVAVLRHGIPVVSTSDDIEDVAELLALEGLTIGRHVPMVVGAGMAPGLSGLLAVTCSRQVARPEEIHVAVHGTAGPACARQHHRALGETAVAWTDGAWVERPGGSGRELCWFPEPIAARDCYRAALADPLLLHHVFSTAVRVSARVSATRRDRLTARLPMLAPPHSGGSIGAVRAEVRGAGADGSRVTVIAGASGRVGELAGAVCAASVIRLSSLPPGVHQPCSEAIGIDDMLRLLARHGVQLQEFTGVPHRLG